MATRLRRVQFMKPLKRSRTQDKFQIMLFKKGLWDHFLGLCLARKTAINTRVSTWTTHHQRYTLLLTTEQLTKYKELQLSLKLQGLKLPSIFCCYHMRQNLHLSYNSITYMGCWILCVSKPFYVLVTVHQIMFLSEKYIDFLHY